MNVLVTGGAGFIGSHLCERLLTDGHAVTAVDNFDPYYSRSLKRANLEPLQEKSRFRLLEEDIRNPDAIAVALSETPPDVIVHLAAKAGVRPSIESPSLYEDVNVLGTQAMLNLAERFDVQSFVLGSSSSVYGNEASLPFSEDAAADHPISPYAASKRAAELVSYTHHHLFDRSVYALRFFTVYGPRQRPDLAIHKFTQMMRKGETIPLYGDGSSSRDYTFVSDIVDGIVAALRHSCAHPNRYETLNLGSASPVQLTDLVSTLADALGVDPSIRHLPEQPGDVDHTYADVRRARDLLGYAPTVSFQDGIAAFADWVREADPSFF
jgi:UDP-glucuronate 4-epimerase